MLFNSFSYGYFLIAAYILYWLIFNRNISLRNLYILVISYLFYGFWNWKLLSLIFLITTANFVLGMLIEKTLVRKDMFEMDGDGTTPEMVATKSSKTYLILAIIVNIGTLGYFKYCNFFVNSFVSLANLFTSSPIDQVTLDIVLPVGISFYTFQGLAYVLDVYKGKIAATKDVISFYAFLSFFPQLIAGPIERAKDFLPQFHQKITFDYDETRKGLFLIAIGLFKKVVIADRVAVYVDSVYANPSEANGMAIILAILFFGFQLYLDFSAYSQIAIGTAKIFGFKLHQNFNLPYLATSFKDFWARWHITLTSWFRDYLYFPLGGSRKGQYRTYLNVLIIFAVSGLWHGASWNFVIWGVLNGIFMAVFDKVFKLNPTGLFPKIGSCLFVVGLWMLSLVFFRAETFADAITVFKNIGFGDSDAIYNFGLNSKEMNFTFMMLAGLMIVELMLKCFDEKLENFFFNKFFPLRWIVYISIVLVSIYLGVYGNGSDNTFIYFQF